MMAFCQIKVLILVLVLASAIAVPAFSAANYHHSNRFYNNNEEFDLIDEDDHDGLDDDPDYPADQPYRPKRPLDIDQLQDFLYNVKTNVLDDSHSDILTLKKNRDFRNNNKVKSQTKKIKPVAASLSSSSTTMPAAKQKITAGSDWIDMDGIQSDQPSAAPGIATGNGITNHTINPIAATSAKVMAITDNPPPYENSSSSSSSQSKSGQEPPPPPPSYPRPDPYPYYPSRPYPVDRRPGPPAPAPPLSRSGQPYPAAAVAVPRFEPSMYPSSNYPHTPSSSWSCQFTPYNNCSIRNDPQIGPLFQLENLQKLMFRSQPLWHLVMNSSAIPVNKIGGRLITPYIPVSNAGASGHQSLPTKGCLTLQYLTTGNEIEKIIVYQQDTDNRCIWSATTGQQLPVVDNKQVELTVDLQPGSDPRFFIEVYLKNIQPRQGIFALGSLNLVPNLPCVRDQRNFCSAALTPPLAKRESDLFEP